MVLATMEQVILNLSNNMLMLGREETRSISSNATRTGRRACPGAGASAATSGGGCASAAVGTSSSDTACRRGVGWATNTVGPTASSWGSSSPWWSDAQAGVACRASAISDVGSSEADSEEGSRSKEETDEWSA